MDDDYLFNEKQSIRESGRSLKKYGSTCCNYIRNNEKLIRHDVEKTDTLQGIALKYGCTTEQIRRTNRLFASDSLFLRQFLLIPVDKTSPFYPEILEGTIPTEAINNIFGEYNSTVYEATSPTVLKNGDSVTSDVHSVLPTQPTQQLPSRPYSIAGDDLVMIQNDNDIKANNHYNTNNNKQSKSLDSVVAMTPDEENRRSINEFLSKIDTTISESRKYVERSKEIVMSQSDNDLFVATEFVQRRNNHINNSYKNDKSHNQHQRHSSTGSASDTAHLLNTTQTRRVKRLEKNEESVMDL